MRRGAMIVAVVLVVAGGALALVPFARPNGTFLSPNPTDGLSQQCPSPIVSAWQSDLGSRGWYGYAPIASVGRPGASLCRPGARDRLAWTAGLWLAAAVGLLVLRRSRATSPRVAPA